MSMKKATEIVKNLKMTILKMNTSDGMYSDNPMFKRPRAKRSDLIRLKNNLIVKVFFNSKRFDIDYYSQ